MVKSIKFSGASIIFSFVISFILYLIVTVLFNVMAFSGNRYSRNYLELSDFTPHNIQTDMQGYAVNSNAPKLIYSFEKEKFISSVVLDLRNLTAKETLIQVYYTNSAMREYDYFACVRQSVSLKNAVVKVPLNLPADTIRLDIGSGGDTYKLKKVVINPHVSDMIKYSFYNIDWLKVCFAFVFVLFFSHLYPKFFILVRKFLSNFAGYLNKNFSLDTTKIDGEKIKYVYQLVLCAFLYLYLCKYYIHIGSMLSSKINWICGYIDCFLYGSVFFAVIALIRMITDRRWFCLVLAVIMLSCFYLSYLIAHNDSYILINVCLVVSCYAMPFRWILRIFILSVGAIVLLDVVFSLCDVIPNLQYNGRGGIRNAFGANYPTDFSASVLYLFLSIWVLLRKKNIMLLVLLALFVFVQYRYTLTKNSIVCSLVFALVILYCLLTDRFSSVKTVDFVNRRMVYNLSLIAFVLFAVLTVVLSYYYDPVNKLFVRINEFISGRIALSNRSINEYGFSPFGKFFIMFGLGSTTQWPPFYNFLDISYINILMRSGICSLLITAVSYVFLVKRAIDCNIKKFVLVMFIVSLHCAIEHHYLDICYNVFLLLTFADLTTECKLKSEEKLSNDSWYYVI